jgi:hypothetical protein
MSARADLYGGRSAMIVPTATSFTSDWQWEPRYKALVKKINFPEPTDGLPGASTATEGSPLRASN